MIEGAAANLEHRELVGGLWDEIGRLQYEFLLDAGLQRRDLLLDIGCGCLRGGVHFIRYLEPGNYFGVDANPFLLDVGYDIELRTLRLQDRMPRSNLVCMADFDFERLGRRFDFAIAHSLFTHLTFNSIRRCLQRLADVMIGGGRFYATFFELPPSENLTLAYTHDPGSVVTFDANDPYHYKVADFRYAVEDLPWRVNYIGRWGHPRAQNMLEFARV